MNISLPCVTDAVIAISTVAGIAILFALALLVAGALVQRDKARNATAVIAVTPSAAAPRFAQQPTQTDRVLEPAGR